MEGVYPMKIMRPLFPRLMVFLLCLVLPGWGTEITPAERLDALKVIRFLDQVAADSLMKRNESPRRMDFTESQFNAYIAYRIASEREQIMKDLRLKLFDQNRIEGKIFIDLKGQKLPSVLKPQMNLYFEGVFTTDNGRIRLDFRKLFLDGQSVPIMLLDMIIFIASKLGQADAGRIGDWYELPLGIKDLRTTPGRVSIYY
jgi:hypothetical protein